MAKQNNSTMKALSAWERLMNPLKNLTANQIELMFENSKHGNDVRLQTAFFQMERTMPIFSICIQKRTAGILSRKWKILPVDESEEAKNQTEFVQNVLQKCDMLNEDGLTSAIEHLALAAFRGRSVIKPFIDSEKGLLLKKIDNWNVLEHNNKLFWNPDVDSGNWPVEGNLQQISENEVLCIRDRQPIDIPGIQIYLRQLVGEQQWARFVERQGIPQIIITAPDGTPDTELQVWNQRAMQIYEGGSGVLPPGAKIDEMTAARGQDPFSQFCQHQMELIAILATGGALSTIGGATGLGSNLADVQNDQFQSLITRDCKKIQNGINSVIIRKIVREMLGTADIKCSFAFVEDEDKTADEYVEIAQKLVAMNIPINLTEFKKLTGISFIKDGTEDDSADMWTPEKQESES